MRVEKTNIPEVKEKVVNTAGFEKEEDKTALQSIYEKLKADFDVKKDVAFTGNTASRLANAKSELSSKKNRYRTLDGRRNRTPMENTEYNRLKKEIAQLEKSISQMIPMVENERRIQEKLERDRREMEMRTIRDALK